MATYMEAFIEYDRPCMCEGGLLNPEPFAGDGFDLKSLTEASFTFYSGGFNYTAFDALGYGRSAKCSYDDDDVDDPPPPLPKFEPRGLPRPCSLTVLQHYFQLVLSGPDLPNRGFWPEYQCVSPEKAEEWVQEHGSQRSEVIQSFNLPGGEYLSWPLVSEPTVYNASWLYPAEYQAAFSHYQLELHSEPAEFSVIFEAMKIMETRLGGGRVRLVFWFC